MFLLALSVVVIGAAAAMAIGALASRGEDEARKTTNSASPSLSPALRDPNGKKACDMAEDAVQHKAWDDYQFAFTISETAKASSDSGIRDLGILLELQLFTAANAAVGKEEPNRLAERHRKLGEIMGDLERYCRTTGLL